MAEPLAKRLRMTDADEGVNEAQLALGNTTENDPTTPTRRRASYRSPTKASLARSHPNILAKSPRKALTEPRGKLLRAELLGDRNSKENEGADILTVPKTVPRPVPETGTRVEHDSGREKTLEDRGGFAAAVAEAFNNSPTHSRVAKRSALDALPPRNFSNRPRANIDDEYLIPEIPVPKLVSRSDSLPKERSGHTSTEPELPPTPVQLGLVSGPDRPRGLASSSSGGPRSGSGKNRKRVRSGTNPITSSPLKPRNMGNNTLPSDPEAEVEGPVPAEEAPESDFEDQQEEPQPLLPPQAEAKQAELSRLQAELIDLQASLLKLESLTDQLSQYAEIDIDELTRQLLMGESDEDSEAGGLSQGLDAMSAHLNLFAPGNLQLSYATSAKRIKRKPKMIHKLTVLVPAPWPSDVMHLSFDITVDAEEASIEAIVQSKPGHFYKHDSLQKWIERRLGHPIHQHDIGGLIWGSGQYFEACIKRARTFKRLSQKHADETVYADEIQNTDKLSAREALVLSHYLDVHQLTFASINTPSAHTATATAVDRSILKCVMLTYDLEISWTGTVSPIIHVSISGVGAKAQDSAKQFFDKLLPIEGVVGAFEKVWQLLEFGPAKENPHDNARKAYGQARQANRKILRV